MTSIRAEMDAMRATPGGKSEGSPAVDTAFSRTSSDIETFPRGPNARVAIELGLIQIETQTRRVVEMKLPALNRQRLIEHGISPRNIAKDKFLAEKIRDGRHDVRGSNAGNRAVRVVGRHRDIEAFTEACN